MTTWGAKIVSNAPGVLNMLVASPPPPGGFCLVETGTNPANPIRNIHIMMPGYARATYQEQEFYPPWLTELKPFQTIRMMEWAGTNRSTEVNWSDRRTLAYPTQAMNQQPAMPSTANQPVTYRGVALEYQVLLANRLHADPWFSIPAQASDSYIRQMALYAHEHLHPILHPYIEFSNEVWNGAFSQYTYANNQGTTLNLDPSPNHPDAGLYWYALRSSQMFDVWNQVYGADANKIVHVISWKQNWPSGSDKVLSYRDLYKKTDVLSVGGYVSPFNFNDPKVNNPSFLSSITKMSVTQVLDALNKSIVASAQGVAANKAVADKYHLGLVVYEGGISFETNMLSAPYRSSIAALYNQATEDPRIQGLLTQLLTVQQSNGVSMFNYFNDVGAPNPYGYGSFGALEYQEQPLKSSSKYQALANYIAMHKTQ